MSEIREELEYFARLAEEKEATEQNTADNEIKAPSQDGALIEEDPYLEAPQGFDKELAETFKDLPLNWRRYLHVREQELDKGFSNLRDRTGDYKWIDDIYRSRSTELQKNGVLSSQDWLKNIIKIDEMLEKDPQGTISMLADSYNIKINQHQSPMVSTHRSRGISDIMEEQLVAKQLSDFIGEVNDKGTLKHPYYKDVIQDMHDLLSRGIVNNLSDAYETAVWSNRLTRDKLIAERTKETLELKSKDAQKSKDASFAPKGKAVPETKDLTLREELEMRFAELED